MGSGTNSGNYNTEVNTALQQANQPKSDLSKQFSGTLQGSYLPAIAGLLNGGSLGNAFPGFGSATPGMIFNQNQLGYVNTTGAGNINYSGSGSSGTPASGQNNNPTDPATPVTGGNTPVPNANPNPTPLGNSSNISSSNNISGSNGVYFENNGDYFDSENGIYRNSDGTPASNQQSQASSNTGVNQGSVLSGATAYANDPLGALYAAHGNGPIAYNATNSGGVIDNRLLTYQGLVNSGYQPTSAETQAYNTALAASQANDTYRQSHGGFDDPAYQQSLSQANNNFPGFLDFQGNVVNQNNSGGGSPANSNYTGPFGDPQTGSSGLYTPTSQGDSTSQSQLQQLSQLLNGQGSLSNNIGQQFNTSGVQGNQSGQTGSQSNPYGSLISQANPNLSGLNLQGMNPQALSSLLQQFQSPNTSSYNPSSSLLSSLANGLGSGSATLPNQQFTPAQLQAANVQNVNNSGAQISTGMPTGTNDPQYQALSQTLQNQFQQGLADTRARFGASGGASRGTPASYAEAQYNAQALPAMQSALGAEQQQVIGNQLTAQNQGNNALLSANQQNLNNSQQNIQNLLQSVGLNNNSNLSQSQQLLSLLGLNSSNALQNQGQANQFQLGQQSNLSSLAQNAGNLNLGQNQLNSQNQLATNSQNSNNANAALQNQLGFQTNQNSTVSSLNNLLAQLSQFNTGQQNTLTQGYSQQQQSANQQQIQNQFTGYQNIASLISGLAGAGIPGGSANVNLGAASQGTSQQFGSSVGSAGGLAGLAALLGL